MAQAKGRSEGRQADETEAYCSRKGYKIGETFIDRGFSAYTGENSDKGDLKAVLDMAAAGKIKTGTHLVVESLDRISRQEITAALSLFLNIINFGLAIDTTFDKQIYTKERCDADPFAAMQDDHPGDRCQPTDEADRRHGSNDRAETESDGVEYGGASRPSDGTAPGCREASSATAATEIEHHQTELEVARNATRMTEHENSFS